MARRVHLTFSGSVSGSAAGPKVVYLSEGLSQTTPMRYPVGSRTVRKLRVLLRSMTCGVSATVQLFKNGVGTAKAIVILAADPDNQKYAEITTYIDYGKTDDLDVRLSVPTDAAAGVCSISVVLE